MNILYIGDNRNRNNWGCRATSMALGGMLRQIGNITGIIDGKEVGFDSMTPVPWNGILPRKIGRFVDRLPTGPLSRIRSSAKSLLQITDDFLEADPARSIDRFMRIKSQHPALANIWNMVEKSDALVVNGEGGYIFTTPPRRDTLFFNFILKLGQQFEKKAYVMNAMISDCPKSGRNEKIFRTSMDVLEHCQAVSVRDSHSYDILKSSGFEGNLSFNPDALFTWDMDVQKWASSIKGQLSRFEPFGGESHENLPELNFDEPYICLGGSSSAAWRQEEAYEAYLKLAKSLSQMQCQLLITPTCGGDAFLWKVAQELKLPYLHTQTPIRLCAGIVGKAAAFVSGRFHPAILASNGGTPCVFLGSNSHKTLSLQQMLEYDVPFEFSDIPSDGEIQEITSKTKLLVAESPRQRIKDAVARRSTEARNVINLIK